MSIIINNKNIMFILKIKKQFLLLENNHIDYKIGIPIHITIIFDIKKKMVSNI